MFSSVFRPPFLTSSKSTHASTPLRHLFIFQNCTLHVESLPLFRKIGFQWFFFLYLHRRNGLKTIALHHLIIWFVRSLLSLPHGLFHSLRILPVLILFDVNYIWRKVSLILRNAFLFIFYFFLKFKLLFYLIRNITYILIWIILYIQHPKIAILTTMLSMWVFGREVSPASLFAFNDIGASVSCHALLGAQHQILVSGWFSTLAQNVTVFQLAGEVQGLCWVGCGFAAILVYVRSLHILHRLWLTLIYCLASLQGRSFDLIQLIGLRVIECPWILKCILMVDLLLASCFSISSYLWALGHFESLNRILMALLIFESRWACGLFFILRRWSFLLRTVSILFWFFQWLFWAWTMVLLWCF